MTFTSQVQKIAREKSFCLRLRDSIPVIERGLEPYFFVTEQKSRFKFSPLYEDESGSYVQVALLHYLLPGYTEQDFDAMLSAGRDEAKIRQTETALQSVRALVHCHPDNGLEPSLDDLNIYNNFYEGNVTVGRQPPLWITGRGTKAIDLLFLRQKEKLNVRRAKEMRSDVEKCVIAATLPRYLRQAGSTAAEVRGIRKTLEEMSSLPWTKYLRKIRTYLPGLACQEHVARFRAQFRTDFTIFPEYPLAVLQAVRRTGLYDAALGRYDKDVVILAEQN